MKPGYKTTDFWMTLVGVAAGLLAMSGAIGNDAIIQGLGIVATTLAPGWYHHKRDGQKRQAMDLNLELAKVLGEPARPRTKKKPSTSGE